MNEYERRAEEIARMHRLREPVLGLGAQEPVATHTPPAPLADAVTVERQQPYRIERVAVSQIRGAYLGADGVLRASMLRNAAGSTEPVVIRPDEDNPLFVHLRATAQQPRS